MLGENLKDWIRLDKAGIGIICNGGFWVLGLCDRVIGGLGGIQDFFTWSGTAGIFRSCFTLEEELSQNKRI